jgi:nitrate/TMAO reductase-like tetraheme cytochrome c subunit
MVMTPADTHDTLRVAPTESGNPLFRSTTANTIVAGNISKSGAALSVSPCYPAAATGCLDLATELLPPAMNSRSIKALYTSGGIPIDTNDSTKYGAFDPAKVTYTASGTPVGATVTISLYGAGSRAVNPGTSYHAASLVSCMECHGGDEPMGHNSRVWDGTQGAVNCTACHYGTSSSTNFERKLWAGGFGLTNVTGDTGATEAHKVFQTGDDNMSRQKTMANGKNSNNGACVACHTHVAVDIEYTRPDTYQFAAVTGTDGVTTIVNYAAVGTNITYSPPH